MIIRKCYKCNKILNDNEYFNEVAEFEENLAVNHINLYKKLYKKYGMKILCINCIKKILNIK